MSRKSTTPLLCAMMFLQFFIWGAWYVTAAIFIAGKEKEGIAGWDSDVIAWTYSVGPIAAVLSPIFLGLVVDRYFASQRVLGLLHLGGGAVMFGVASVAGDPIAADTYSWLLLGYMLCYMPTLGLTNSVAFSHIEDQAKQFPLIRVFGTLGWIVAGTIIGVFMGEGADLTTKPFYMAAWASVGLGAFSFFLPHTPPPAAGKEVSLAETLGLGALNLMRRRSFTVFIVCSFLICIPLAAYYQRAPEFARGAYGDDTPFVMSFGQWAEVLFMLIMPWFFVRLGVKWMLAVGMLAWVVRYGLFAVAADGYVAWMILGGIVLHGICYDFFFVTGQIYVDQRASPQMRGQAQSFLVVVTQGFGLGIGAQVIGGIADANTTGQGETLVRDWSTIWVLPCIFAAVILLAFLFLFRDDPAVKPVAPAAPTPEGASG